MESTNSSVALNVSVIRREIYTGPQVSIFFVSALPTVVLSVLIILALLVAKDIKWKMRVILINILVAEVVFSLSLCATYLGYPIREMLNLSDKTALILCRFQLGSEIIGALAKLGTIMFYSEKIYKKFLILSKKRYMWQACERDGTLDEKVGKKGVLLARRDNSKFIRSVYEKMTEMIFQKCTKDDIIACLTERLNDLFRGMLDLDEYVITKSVGDVSGDYDQETSKLGSYKVKSLADDPAKRELQLKGKSEREFYMSSCPPQVRLGRPDESARISSRAWNEGSSM